MRRGFSVAESSLILVGIIVLLTISIAILHMPAYWPLFAALLGCVCLALHRGFPLGGVAQMAGDGIGKATVPIGMLALIGVLMGLWRLNGTAATVAIYGSALMSPRHFALSAFILCAAVSMAVGTANGAASIIGVPLMMVGRAYHLPEGLLAGAVISGIYLGDRSSLVSSVLHMVARLTGSNPRAVFRRLAMTLVPAAMVSALLYWLAAPGLAGGGKVGASGLASGGNVSGPASVSVSASGLTSATAHTPAAGPAREAELGLPPAPAPARVPASISASASTSTRTSVSTSIPASGSRLMLDALKRGGTVSPGLLLAPAFMMIMAAFRVPILTNLTLNVLVAAVVAVVTQNASPAIVVRTALLGHHASGALPVAPVTAGGGLVSMVSVLLVLISSTALSGILVGTGIIDAALGKWLSHLGSPRRILFATMAFSVAVGMVASNQALSVVLPCTLLERVYHEKRLPGLALAHAVSDSGVIVAPLVPWSVAALGPAAILGVSPGAYIPYAFLCWALPATSIAWILVRERSYAPLLAERRS